MATDNIINFNRLELLTLFGLLNLTELLGQPGRVFFIFFFFYQRTGDYLRQKTSKYMTFG